jgi:hypothetical protein
MRTDVDGTVERRAVVDALRRQHLFVAQDQQRADP